jgi:hypothetical protein
LLDREFEHRKEIERLKLQANAARQGRALKVTKSDLEIVANQIAQTNLFKKITDISPGKGLLGVLDDPEGVARRLALMPITESEAEKALGRKLNVKDKIEFEQINRFGQLAELQKQQFGIRFEQPAVMSKGQRDQIIQFLKAAGKAVSEANIQTVFKQSTQ